MLASAVLAAFILIGCGAAAKRLPPQTHAPPPLAQRALHIAVVVMENHEYGEIIGSPSAPYINRLARGGALSTQTYATSHPSLPNYLALTGGSTFGIDSDCTDCTVPGRGIAGQLAAHGLSWKAYMEDLPHPCFTGADAGGYAKKHDPFAYYRQIVHDRAACNRIVPLSQLSADERARHLPTLTWITPNLCHDMHDCDVATGDRFLSRLIPPLLHALGPRGLLILTWDEGTSDNGCCRLAAGGHVAMILAGALAKAGAHSSTPVDHYSILQAIDDLSGLPRLGAAACTCTPSLASLLRAPASK
jgi:phosphatidylinositol-3-phosphatase